MIDPGAEPQRAGAAWIKAQGGLAAMAEMNDSKARLLYDYLDASDFFRATAGVTLRVGRID